MIIAESVRRVKYQSAKKAFIFNNYFNFSLGADKKSRCFRTCLFISCRTAYISSLLDVLIRLPFAP